MPGYHSQLLHSGVRENSPWNVGQESDYIYIYMPRTLLQGDALIYIGIFSGGAAYKTHINLSNKRSSQWKAVEPSWFL